MDYPAALQNILAQLQQEPQRYKLFGVYWWPVKALLRARFGVEQLYMLGDYIDPETASLAPAGDLEATLTAALEEYEFNAVFPHPESVVEAPDGELVRIHDEDADL